MSEPQLQIGQVVLNRFRIEAVIGEGGMGTIYRARHVKLPRSFALKLLKQSLAVDKNFVTRFLREAVVASQIVHPGVVNVTDFGQLEDGSYYIAMEYLEGKPLDDALERQGRFPLDRALNILIQLTDALDYCHVKGVVHRDLKTDNVLLCCVRGRQDVVKLVDFGIARMMDPNLTQWAVTQAGTVFGTPEYLSPERAMDQDTDGRSDIYSLGVIAFELVTGTPPFTGKYTEILRAHVGQLAPAPSSRIPVPVPPLFDQIVLKCLAKKPEERYQTCVDLLQDWQRLRGQLAGFVPHSDPEVAPSQAPHGRRVETAGSWSTLALRRSSAGWPESRDAADSAPDLATLARAVRHAREADAIRSALRNTMKEIAFTLQESLGASGAQLNEILKLERELRQVGEEQTLLAQQREHLRVETEEYAVALSHLLQDSPGAPGATSATAARRQHVQHQLDNLRQGSDQRKTAIDQERERCRAEARQREATLAEQYTALSTAVNALRAQSSTSEHLSRLFQRLDNLAAQLEAVWEAFG